jgi:porphobilinogen deaminase
VGVWSELKGEVAELDKDGVTLVMTGTVTSLDGKHHVEVTHEGSVKSVEDATLRGKELAEKLMEKGADVILAEVKKDRAAKQTQQAVQNEQVQTVETGGTK